MKKRNVNSWVLLGVNLLAWLYLLLFVGGKFGGFEGYANENVGPTIENAKTMTWFILPAFFVYIVSVILLMIKGIRIRKAIFPVTAITLYLFGCFLGIAKSGSAFGWLIILTLIPFLILILLLFVIGLLLDKKSAKMEKIHKINTYLEG